MRVPLSWLRELAPVEGDVPTIAEHLSDLGMAVESITRTGEGLDGVIVAKVLDLRPHPDADKVQLVDVDPGTGESLQVVCGAFNMTAGDLVPLATVGARLPGGVEIGRRKMRGEWSNGMLCSAVELELGDDAGGILVLSPDLPLGAPLVDAMGLGSDVVFELEINANRPDAMSVAGVARDLAARLAVPFALPEVRLAEEGPPAGELASVEIVATDLCGRFVARVLRDVRIGPSPAWLATRLTLAGMRPISNVVDVSNYVMLELGQPNHAYDLDRLAGRGLRIRRARAGETLTTLDDVARSFIPDDLLICDANDRAVGIAGIMGGADTEIADDTSEVLLELAWFDPMTIARTAKRLGLRSEASARFERGCDWQVIDLAAARFCQLLTGAATPCPGFIDERGQVPDRSPIKVRTSRVNALLGTDVTVEQIKGHLDPIGFTARLAGDGDLDVALPTWRLDSSIETDVIEEVARHYGYSKIPATKVTPPQIGRLSPYQRARRRLRDVLAGLGLSEAMPMPFIAPDDLVRAGMSPDAIRIANPLDASQSLLRPSLLPGLLHAVEYNASHQSPGVHLFEVGHVYRTPPAGQELPDEREHLGVVQAGRDAAEAKRLWDALAAAMRFEGVRLEPDGEVPGLHPTRTARLVLEGEPVGVVGEVDPGVLEAYGIGERVGWIELDLERSLPLTGAERTYRVVSRYPSSEIDLAFVVDDAVPASAVEATIRDAAGELLARLRLFDVFRSDTLGGSRRSLAFSLRLQAPDRTLTDDEIADVRRRAIDAVESAHGAQLRG